MEHRKRPETCSRVGGRAVVAGMSGMHPHIARSASSRRSRTSLDMGQRLVQRSARGLASVQKRVDRVSAELSSLSQLPLSLWFKHHCDAAFKGACVGGGWEPGRWGT